MKWSHDKEFKNNTSCIYFPYTNTHVIPERMKLLYLYTINATSTNDSCRRNPCKWRPIQFCAFDHPSFDVKKRCHLHVQHIKRQWFQHFDWLYWMSSQGRSQVADLDINIMGPWTGHKQIQPIMSPIECCGAVHGLLSLVSSVVPLLFWLPW